MTIVAFSVLGFPSIAASAAPAPSVVVSASSTGVTVSQLVSLSATASGGVGPYTYQWTMTTPGGSASALSSPTSATPTFTPDVAGTYQLSVKATDSTAVPSPAQVVTVAASAPRTIPTSTILGATFHITLLAGTALLTAAVAPVPDGGTMAFYDNGNLVALCSARPVSTKTGRADCTVTFSSVGIHSMTSTYSGDVRYGPSSSNVLTEHVTYGWKVLFNRARPRNRGTTLHVRVELDNAAGTNVSSSRIALTITGFTPNPRPGTAPAGSLAFVTLGTAGIYERNINTFRFPRGTYTISFAAARDPTPHRARFTVS